MTVNEAISWINKLYLKADFTDEYGDMEDTEPYEEAIKRVTETLKQTRWIPVNERLPESKPEDLEYPTVIICLSDGTVELGCFYESTKEWGAGENFDRLRNPIAWLPLPEPCKTESEGNE